MSVRDRIQGFEAISHGKPEEKEASNPTSQQNGKKFFHPRKQSKSKTDHVVVLPQLKTKQSAISEFEADLQDVWSVRKNVRHTTKQNPSIHSLTGASTVAMGIAKFSQSYSRHGAIPAQPAGDPSGEQRFGNGLNLSKSANKRAPLQEQNQSEMRSWNLRTPGFSYTEGLKRPGNFPLDDGFPQTKLKTSLRGEEGGGLTVKPTMTETPLGGLSPMKQHFMRNQDLSDRKSQYAHKMAQAHLRSVGMGDFTPQNTGYIKEQQHKNTTKLDGKPPKWRKFDEDEFSFD